MNPTRRHLIAELRMLADGDMWDTTMRLWFTVADELYHNRDANLIPATWRFRPSPLGPQNEKGEYETDLIESVESEDDLLWFGELLNRYAALLQRHGKSY